MPRALIQERGNRYVNLTVLRHSHTARSGAVWECLCGGCGPPGFSGGNVRRVRDNLDRECCSE